MTADYADWTVPQANASAVAATGVPLLTAATGILQQSFNPAAGATQSSGIITVRQTGFEVIVTSSFSVAPTTPFVVVQLEWFSSGYSARVATDTYVCAASTTPGAFTTYITGATKGDQVNVHVTNLDGLQVNLTTVAVLENSRLYDKNRVWWDNGLNAGKTVTGWTLPTLPADETVLGMAAAASVPAAGNIAWLCGPHEGLIDIALDFGGGPSTSITAQVASEPGSFYVANNPVYSVATPPLAFQIAGTRSPLRFQLHNSSAGAIAVNWSMIRVA